MKMLVFGEKRLKLYFFYDCGNQFFLGLAISHHLSPQPFSQGILITNGEDDRNSLVRRLLLLTLEYCYAL